MIPASIQDLVNLALKSLTEPKVVMREVLGFDINRNQLFQLTLLLVVLNLIAGLLFEVLSPDTSASGGAISDGIVAFFFLQLVTILGGTGLLFAVGRMFGGEGDFDACFKTVVWLNFVFFLIQFAMPVARAVSVSLEGLVFLAMLIIGFVQLTAYVMVVHGFTRTVPVVFGIIGAQFLFGIVLILLLSVLGIDLPLEPPADV